MTIDNKMKRITLIFVLILHVASFSSFAQTESALKKKAFKFYDAGKKEKALKVFIQLGLANKNWTVS